MIIIGEKINGSIPSVQKIIETKDSDAVRDLAKKQAGAGVTYIDVCASVSNDIEEENMKWLINLVQEVTDLPISVDSPSVSACVDAMKYCNKPGIINSVSMEGNKIETVFPVIADTSWECVALLCDDTGIPQTAEKRLEVLEKIMEKAKEYNIDPSRIHIDPLVEMLCTSEEGVSMIIQVITEIKKRYPTIHITAAISNISYNLPVRRLVNQSFLVLAMNAGLDSAILDPLNRDLMGMIYATESLLGLDDYCMEYITAYRNNVFGTVK